MDSDSLQARIERETAELHALYPQIKNCQTALVRWTDPEGSHYSLRLDIRWPQHQTLISGEAKDNPNVAVAVAFAAARQRVQGAVAIGRRA